VDLFSLGSNNLTEARSKDQVDSFETYHHSRLMGVADIENTVCISVAGKSSHIGTLGAKKQCEEFPE